MKKAVLLLLCFALALCACDKNDPVVSDADLTGETVDVSSLPVSYYGIRKVFVLNEGQMGSNNATLDVLRLTDGQYITDVFKKMNPSAGAGLGDVGNDIAIIGDEVWIIVNNSGIVEVLSAENEKEIAAIKVPTPRRIAFDDKYAYVTSWAGAYAKWEKDENGNSNLVGSANPKGQVYKIDLKSKKVIGSVEVGYQPEGLVCFEGKLYVANSGGISYQLPPDYAYDKTLSVIDTETFTVTNSVEVAINLKDVYVNTNAKVLYVTSQGDYRSTHSALYAVPFSGDMFSYKAGSYVTVSCKVYNDIYCIGAANEFDWENPARDWQGWYYSSGHAYYLGFDLGGIAPYGLYMVTDKIWFIADAGDYFNPGTVTLFNEYQKVWTATAGVCPGHFATW